LTTPDEQFAIGLIAGRRSVRHYAPRPVAPEVIDDLLRLATCAPSAHNRQPWRFVVLLDEAPKHALASAMGKRLRTDRLHDADPHDSIEADVARSYARITSSPVVVVVAMTLESMDVYPDARRQQAERHMAVQSTAMAVQNLLLAAHAYGLGACWMCAPLFCIDVVANVLRLPSTWEPQALITLGHPADAGKPMSRRALDEVVRYWNSNP
jgi:F420 biosynthesis protein FbiB-like protein